MVILRAPSDASRVFRSHGNYVAAFATLTEVRHERDAVHAYTACGQRISASGILTANAGNAADITQVRRSLSQAWGTELLMRLTRTLVQEDELVRVSNIWIAVQAYYAVYHCTQAVAVACGIARPVSHPATQKQFQHLWSLHRAGILPWSLAVGEDAVAHAPTEATPGPVHPWTACTSGNALNLAFTALRSTRDGKIPDAVKKARQRKQAVAKRAWEQAEAARAATSRWRRMPTIPLPRLTAVEKQSARAAVPATTLIDYLYRLRIRANYEDASVFADGPEGPAQSKEFRRDLCIVTGTTMLLSELAISQIVGKTQFLNWVDTWTRNAMPRNTRVGLRHRRDALDAFG